jgi:hypothetical protein
MAGKPGMRSNKPKALETRRFQRSFLQRLDARSKTALVLKGRLQQLMSDLGGAEHLSYQQIGLCERSIFVEARLIELEDEYAAGQGFDHSEHLALIQALNSIYQRLGVRRVAKPLPSALEYAALLAKESAS